MSVLDIEPGRSLAIPGPLQQVRCRRFLTLTQDGREVGYVNAEFDFTQLAPSLYETALEALAPRSLDLASLAPGLEATPRATGPRPRSTPPRGWWRRLFGIP